LPALGGVVCVAAVAFGSGALVASGQVGLTRIGEAPAKPAGATDLGTETSGAEISGEIVLRPRDEPALEAFIAAASRRGSAQFGHYLARGEFATRFAPSASTVAQVSAELGSRGLGIVGATADHMVLRFRSSAATIERALATSIHRYRLPSGRIVRQTSGATYVPSAVAANVAAVIGIDTPPLSSRAKDARRDTDGRIRGPHAPRPASAGAARTTTVPVVKGAPHACADASAAAVHEGGLTDDQIVDSYGAFGLYSQGDTGAGVHIGVFEEESLERSDIQHFDSCFFGAKQAKAMMERLHLRFESGLSEGPGEGESLLDVEDVSAVAPGAEIDMYDDYEEVPEIEQIVQEDRDQLITSSYGEICGQQSEEAFPERLQAINYLLQEGAAQGQTFLAASGDNGSDECAENTRAAQLPAGQNPVSTDPLADEPYAVAVGGTTITAAGQPVHEHAWNNGGGNGAGSGGIAQDFVMPSWQRDATIPGLSDGLPGGLDWESANSVERRYGYPQNFCQSTLSGASAATPCRLEPDVSAQADWFTGAITIYSKEYVSEEGEEENYFTSPTGWVTNGGTSSSTPLWTAMLALVDASPQCRSQSTTREGLGFILPDLYAVASNPTAYAASFNDVTEGNDDIYGLDGGGVFPARAGFDLATGLGSPRLTGEGGTPGLAYYLCSYAGAGTRPSVSSISPAVDSTAGGELVTVSGKGFESAGEPDVAGVQVGAWQAPASSVHVTGAGTLTITLPAARETLPAGTQSQPDGAGNVDIVVTLRDGESSATGPNSTFLYVEDASGQEAPSITGVYPTGGDESAPAPIRIFGGGFVHATAVSFGGVAATHFKVLSPWVLEATPPPYSSQTTCAPLPKGGVYEGEGPANDICQTQVVVHEGSAVSATASIRPPLEGDTAVEEPDGALVAPNGCGCEVFPPPTEYDYAPAPTITSLSTSAGPGSLASASGGTLITLHGTGLNHSVLRSVFFSEEYEETVYDTGTELQVSAPALEELGVKLTAGPTAVPVSVTTLAGTSAPAQAVYAGIPVISGVKTGSRLLNGHPGAVDTGGAPLTVSGKGLSGQVTYVHFDEVEPTAEGSSAISYAFTEAGARLSLSTLAELPALVNVEACTVSGCSSDAAADELYLYPAGQPQVQSLKPDKGPSQGGTNVTVSGRNLGCALSVSFGSKASKSITAGKGPRPCGSSTELKASSPKGRSGQSVPVTVQTWESYFTGGGDGPSSALFTYGP
jgi:hypothetical protein